MRLIQISVTSVWLLRAVEMDFARGKIRNRWLMMGILLGVVLWIPGMKEAGFPELLGGLLLPVLICWIPFRMRGLGAGDIKLLCVVGCLNGSRDIIYCICISFLLAAGFSFGRLLNRRQLWTSLQSCVSYFQIVVQKGRIIPYPERTRKGARFHFSAAILVGYAVILGVNVCKTLLW